MCPWSLALASSISVLGLESVCPRKGCPWPWPWPRIFFVSLALASSLVSSTPPLVKKSKEKSREEFGRRLDSNYFSANKVFWQTIRRLRGKRSSITYSIKDSDGNILTDENEILSRWREYFKDLLNPVKVSTRDTHEVTHLGEDEVFTAAEVATAIKGIKSGKAAGEDEIRPEMLKALTGEGILWLTRVCQVAWKLGKTPRDWQTGVIIPIFKKGDRKQCTNYRGISLLSLPGKVYAKCLERKCREIVE